MKNNNIARLAAYAAELFKQSYESADACSLPKFSSFLHSSYLTFRAASWFYWSRHLGEQAEATTKGFGEHVSALQYAHKLCTDAISLVEVTDSSNLSVKLFHYYLLSQPPILI